MSNEMNQQIAIDFLDTMIDTVEVNDADTLYEMIAEVASDLDALEARGNSLHRNLLYEIIRNAWERDLF